MTTVPRQRSADEGSAANPNSLTQAGTLPSGTCPECGSSRMTALAMTLTDGTPVEFASCHECEHRHWSHDGAALEFADVITRTRKLPV